MTFWQVAAGWVGRDYSEDFLRFGMAFVGEQLRRRRWHGFRRGTGSS